MTTVRTWQQDDFQRPNQEIYRKPGDFLSLSNFIPTVHFGLLTGLAMLVALIADLTLLPRLLILTKPFGDPRTIDKRSRARFASMHTK